METATQTKGRELRTEWDSTKKMQHFSSMSFASAPSISSGNIFSEETFQASGSSSVFLRSNSNNSSSTPLSDPKHSWNNINVSEFWRIDPAITGLEDSALVAGQTGKNSFISTCSQGFSQNQVAPSEPGEEAVSAVSCTSSWQEVQVQASDPEIVPLVCDPQVNLEQRLQSSCAGINSQEYNSTANHNFSSFLNSITDSHKRHEDFPFTGLKSTQGRGEYSAELQAYLGHANININLGSYIPPTTSTAMLNPASLEQFNQGFGRNSVDMFSGEIHAVEPNTSNSSVTASTTLAMSDMHMRCLKTMPSMRTFDVVGSHFYTVSDPQGVGADAFDHAQRIRARDSIFSLGVQENGIDPGTVVIPETKSAVSAGKMDFKDNSVIIPADCSVKQLQQKSLERTINPYKRICTDVGKNNLPTKKKSALWTSNVNSNGALQNSSMVTACKSSIASKTAMGPALNTNLRQRTKQGSASDPQSIAARHRRERISERLKILQDLVPNGSKVDLVTMLEKAINYVKFLQLQVKVLTTDEYWPMQDTAPKIMKVEDALQAIASAEAAEGIYTSGITNMDCTRTQTDQNRQNS